MQLIWTAVMLWSVRFQFVVRALFHGESLSENITLPADTWRTDNIHVMSKRHREVILT